MDKKTLKTNCTDVIVSALSAAVGYVPAMGGVMPEIVHNAIPQQRQDRIVDFIAV